MQANAILEAPSPETIGPEIQTSSPQRILVVDDDDDIRRLNSNMLVHHGYHVDVAKDGAIAWQALIAGSYDLLITDNSMPNVTGVELLKKVHGARMALPVIMATGVLPSAEFTRRPWLVPAATLLKPYTSAELLDAVRSVLRATEIAGEPMVSPENWRGAALPNRLML